MGRKPVRPEALAYYCNVCGVLKEEVEPGLNVPQVSFADLAFAFKYISHWCYACKLSKLSMIKEWKRAFEAGEHISREMTEATYSSPVTNFCISCGSKLEPPRKCYCKKCKENSQYQAKPPDPDKARKFDQPFRMKYRNPETGEVGENVLDMVSGDYHGVGEGWYCNTCGRWMRRFPNEHLSRGATKFWCSVCINNPAKRRLIKDQTTKAREKWQYCIRCRGSLLPSDRQLCTKCRRLKRPNYLYGIESMSLRKEGFQK